MSLPSGHMPHNLDIILTLTGGLAAALVLGFITQRLKLSPIVGYIVAGVVVGPFTPGFVAKGHIAEQFAEIGVILLMFGVGLHFHVKDLLAVRKIALPGALAQIAVATGLGVLLAQAIGWSIVAGVVFGLALSVASTVVLLRVLADSRALHTPAGHLAVGWLIVEDVFTVLVLVMLPIFVGGAEAPGGGALLISVGQALLKLGALAAFTFLVGPRAIPVLLGYVSKVQSRELFTLTVLVLVLGIAIGSALLFGASMALGAFLAGMIVGQSEFSARAASEALPMRDAFAVLFFVSVGMLLDPAQLGDNAGLIAATLALILVAKPAAALLVVQLFRQPLKTGLSVAIALAQIGEFSFILASLGRRLDILPGRATQVLVAAAILSITLNPLLFRLVGPTERWLSRRSARRPDPAGDTDGANAGVHSAIVVGYGPVGRTLVRLLRENSIEPTVIELNHATMAELGREGVRAVYGDASQPEILERAGVRRARSLVYAASGTPVSTVVEAAKLLNPQLRILARSDYVREVPAARNAGAHIVVSAEAEVAMAMTEHLLTQLGATSEQLDRARDRLRRELASDGVPGVREPRA